MQPVLHSQAPLRPSLRRSLNRNPLLGIRWLYSNDNNSMFFLVDRTIRSWIICVWEIVNARSFVSINCVLKRRTPLPHNYYSTIHEWRKHFFFENIREYLIQFLKYLVDTVCLEFILKWGSRNKVTRMRNAESTQHMFYMLFHSQSKHPSYLPLLAGNQCQGGVSRRSRVTSLLFSLLPASLSWMSICKSRHVRATKVSGDPLPSEKLAWRGKTGEIPARGESKFDTCERITEEGKRTHGGVREPRDTLLTPRDNCADWRRAARLA